MRRAGLTMAVLAAAGCIAPPFAANPYREIQKVAVAPILCAGVSDPLLRAKIDAFGTTLANELTKFEGFQVVRPETVAGAMKTTGTSLDGPAAAVKLARVVGADALLVAEVTDFQDITPKRVAIAIQIYPVRSPWRGGAFDPRALEQHGKPFQYEARSSLVPALSIERVFDANEAAVATAARVYGRSHDQGRPLAALDEDAFLKVTGLYLQFVSNRLIHEFIAIETRRQAAEAAAIPTVARR